MTSGLDTDEGFLYVKGNTLYDWETIAELAEEEAAIGYVGDPDESAHGQVGIASNGDAIDFHPGDHPMSGPEAAFAYKFPKRAHEWDYEIDPMCVELAHNESPTAVQLSGWEPIEYPHDLLEANHRVVREEHDGTYVADDATVAPGSVVAGPAVLLEGTHVMENATVEKSVLLADSYVGPNSYVGHSILGEGMTVEQGVTTVTRDSGDSTVKLRFSDGSKADTESDVFGSVCGPKAKVRGGTTLREGSVVGSGTVVQSGQTL
jgi:acetyltransferase-like isoleucine patch superfamily enzyme